jgi:indolepyruvate ferredoxin oxidoreductase beta subunit
MNIVVTGKGGQGTVLLTRVATLAAQCDGRRGICTETLGMAQRGASVISFIRIGSYISPLIRQGTADVAFSLLESETARAISYLAPRGVAFVNAEAYYPVAELGEHVAANRIRIACAAADKEVEALGNPRGANLFLLAYAIPAISNFLTMHAIEKAVRRLLKPQILQANLAILDAGFRAGSRAIGGR